MLITWICLESEFCVTVLRMCRKCQPFLFKNVSLLKEKIKICDFVFVV